MAEAVVGVGHRLHSRAPHLLALLFEEDLLRAEELQSMGGKKAMAAAVEQEALRACSAEVAQVALHRLLVHLRRGSAADLWKIAHKETKRRLDVVISALMFRILPFA
jgi:U3 small nucleolar RNA-associated protein 20